MFAELRFRDGQKEKLSVKVEPDLSSVISGVQELRSTVKILLSGLVEQERAGAGGELTTANCCCSLLLCTAKCR